MGLQDTLGELASAINDELKTIKRYGATSRITLFAGKKSSRDSSKSILYRFEMLIQRTLPEGSRGKLIFQNKSTDADVVAVEGQYIWLSLSRDMGDRIPQAYYDTDLSFILEDLKEKYSQAVNGSLSMSQAGINLLVGNISGTVSKDFSVSYTDRDLSPEQICAIDKILSAEIGIILGPPGTGKTRTLAGLLTECFMNGERILVCGYTNRAVDEALSAFKKMALSCVKDDFLSAYNKGRIVRKGTNVFPEIEPIIKSSEEIAESMKTELQKQLDEARRNLRDTQKNLNEMWNLVKKVEIKQRLQGDINSQYRILVEKSAEYDKNDQKIGNLDNQIQEKNREHSDLRDSGVIKWLTSIKRRHDLEKKILALNRERDILKEQQPRLIRVITEQRKKWEELREKFDKYEAATIGTDLEDLKRMMKTGTSEVESLKRRINDLEKSIEDTTGYVINNALVMFATLSKAHIDRDLAGVFFDRVIIDEASMASLPQVFLAGFKAKKSIYIFGDHKQLSPICTSSKDEVRKWFAKDIYQYANLVRPSINNVSQLETQRRMPDDLGELVSQLFYEGILRHDYDIDNELSVFPWLKERHVTLLDTSEQGAFCNRHECGRGYSRINVAHGVIALSFLKEAAQLGIAPKKMAYITPYRAQAEFFGALVLKNREVSEKEHAQFLPDLRWGTVHRFQGGEAELVIYDTCESRRQQPTKLTGGSLNLEGDDPEIDDASRLHCVALSRAKSHLIILANLKWLRENLAPNSKLSNIIETLSEMGCIIPVPKHHSALRLFEKSLGQKNLFTLDLGSFPYVLCNEAIFYDLLADDFRNCKKKLIIVSPYLSLKRISFLEQFLRHLNSKRIKVTVWTKDPLDLATTGGHHAECAKILEEFGFKVMFRSGTHEKAVILDGMTAYYGSLNPLSHRDTKETMLRISDIAFAKALVDHLNLEGEEPRPQEREIQQSSLERIFKKVGLKEIKAKLNEEIVRKVLKKLRWVIAEDKGLPRHSTLYNRTIDWLIKERPKTRESLLDCEEFRKNRSNISGYEDFVVTLMTMMEEN